MRPGDFLHFLESPEGAALLSGAVRRSLRRGQRLSSPRQRDNAVFVVRSGRLRVHLESEERELTLAFLEPGDVYATHTPAWVTAAGPAEVLVIEARAFSEFLLRVPAATAVVMRALGLLLGHTVELVETLVFRDAHERLAHFLAATTRRHGQRSGDTWCVRLHFTVTEIALLLGSTRQTVSAVLNEMQRQGVVARQGRRQLLVIDMQRLESWGASRPAEKKSTRSVGQPTDGRAGDP
jgi:CRP-like cAMP-binding protein